MRLAMIGDVGGQLEPFRVLLTDLGVDVEKGIIPDDLMVCQVGDLIHRGPNSPGVVALVDQLMARNPGQWFQLAGNHEAQYLFRPVFDWPETLPAETVSTLRRWFSDGSMRLAAAFTTAGEMVRRPGGVRAVVGADDLLVTHAGLSRGAWTRLGAPAEARAAASAVNGDRFDGTASVYAPGRMLGSPSHFAGPVWAEAVEEVLLPWAAAGDLSFSQVHGHSSPLFWSASYGSVHPRLKAAPGVLTHADRSRRIFRTVLGNRAVWAIDPGHMTNPAPVWSPLVLNVTGSYDGGWT